MRDRVVSDPTSRRRLRLLAAGAAVLGIALVAGAGDAGRVQAQGVAPAPPPPPVTVSRPLVRETVEWDEYTGQFAAVDYIELRARVSGYLQSINFQDGQIVKAGDLLFQIDPRPFEASLLAAKAQLAQAEARLELANHQLARAVELRQRDFLAASTYDERLNEVRGAAAAGDTARSQIRTAELDIEYARITAPITGRISRHEVSIGNLISGSPGGSTTMLTTIVSIDPIYFYFDMSEGDYLAYQRATAQGRLSETRESSPLVQVRLSDETEWKRAGLINFVDNQVNRSAGTVRARAVFPNPDGFLTPGQFARVRIPGSERYDAILIPDSAVVTDQSRKLVMTVAEDGTVVPKVVRPGPTTDDGLRIIRSGLTPTDQVIINGLVRARPGGKVTPQPGKIEAVAKAG
jgi:RND family efflux transporter MFP subunit